MKTKRIKKKLPTLATREDAEAVMNDLAMASNNARQLQSKMDAEVLAIQAKYAPQLAAYQAGINEYTNTLHSWAAANPSEFPKDRKSIEMTSGTLGFRTGTPKLERLLRSCSWESVLGLVQAILPNFIRNKPEIDKESIIAQADELKEFLPMCGLKITQCESFFVDPDLTKFETKIKEAA